MVGVLVIRPKIGRFKLGQGDGFLMEIKIRSTPSFGGELKPETQRRKVLRHVKIICKYEQKYFTMPNL
jgi:hypothetical protein